MLHTTRCAAWGITHVLPLATVYAFAHATTEMPGGLASWLDDTNGQPHVPRRNDAGSADRRASVSVIDEAAPSTCSTGGQGPVPDSAEKEPWDPFGSDCREDAFARLLSATNRPAAGSSTTATTTASTLSPPAASSSWDPFASTGDGKENRGNALSKLLASPSQPNSGSKGRSGPSSAKRKRPAVGSTLLLNAAAAGGARAGGAGNAEAVTRFCECPVCGKRVRSCCGVPSVVVQYEPEPNRLLSSSHAQCFGTCILRSVQTLSICTICMRLNRSHNPQQQQIRAIMP